MSARIFSSVFTAVALALLLAANASGQGERATVTGTATDSSGAVVVGAEVAIRNADTNIVTRTKTNSAGIYYLPGLPPGRYELRVELSRFRPAVVADIPLGAGLTATFNVTLEVGAVTEAVEVQATAVQLEAQTTGLGKILETRHVSELPVLGRNPLQLVSVLPGVVPIAGTAVGDVTSGAKMSGGLARENAVLTDGGESRATANSRAAFTVPIESVAEFRVDTATYSAEFGRSGGGVVNVVTKSGTNALHGVVYEFLRNDHLNANSWENNRNKVGKGMFQWNNFGAAAGGPIIHNRTFFFVNYDGLRQGSPIQYLGTVPSSQQKQGDFSRTFDSAGRPVTIYDPLTTRADPSQSGKTIRDPFTGNRIPQARVNAVSQNVLKYWPDANRPGEGPTQFNNYFTPGKRAAGSDIWVTRIDHMLNDKHRLFGRFSGRQQEAFSAGMPAESVAVAPQSISSTPARSALVSLISTFTPSLLGELRLSYTRLQTNTHWDQEGSFNLASLGFPQSVSRAAEYQTFPNISVSQYTVGTGLSVAGGSSAEVDSLSGTGKTLTPQDTWHLQYHVTAMRNRHKVKFGTELELLRLNSFSTNSPTGAYFFDRVYTQGPDPLVRSSTSGHGFASMLLGVPVSGRMSFDPALALYRKFYGLYVQDDVQLTNKLTANLGLRYEYTQPWAEKWGRIGYFDFDAAEPVTGAKGTFKILQPGQFQTDPLRKNFGPRLGLAYRAIANTVIRASAGIFYSGSDTINPGTSDWGNGLFIMNEGSLGPPNPLPNTPPVGGSWSNPFAAGLLQPNRSETFPGQNVRTFTRHHLVPYVANWTFNIQRMLTPTLLVQVGYVGNKVTHLSQNRFYNSNDPLLLSLGSQLLQQVPNPYFGKITSGTLSYPTVELRQVLRPYPQYLQLLVPRDGFGDSHYDSLQVRVDKQYSHGLSFSAGYSISKNMTNTFESGTGEGGGAERGTQNALYNANYNRSLDSNDVPQRLVLSYMWELPVGKGKSYLSRGLMGAIVGNWQFSGITVLQSGTPRRIAASDTTGLLDFALNVGRGNRLKDPVLPSSQRTMDRYFATDAFAIAAPFTIPNDSLNQPRLRDPGRRNFDVAVFRNQRFRERYNVQFRGEFYNLFNTPALSLGNASSVTVNTPQFGKVLSGTSPRNIQFGLRLVF